MILQNSIMPVYALAAAWPCAILAFLFLRRRDAVRRRESEARAAEESVRAKSEAERVNEELRESLAALRGELDRQQETWSLVREAPRASLNFRRANQVSRLYRQGESIPGIAANLDMRRNEVALILKAQIFAGRNANSSQTTNPPATTFR